jgi:hypothetical protein
LSEDNGEFSVKIERLENYKFIVDFGLERGKEETDLVTDEPPPT